MTHPLQQLPALVARRPVPLRAGGTQRGRRAHDPLRHADVPPRSGHGPGDAQRPALFHARQQRDALPLLRGRRARRQAVARGVGPPAAPGLPRDALELAALLHRLSARVLVPHRRRGRLPDPGRVSHLEHGPEAGRFRRATSWPGNTPSGCRSAGTIPAWSSGTPATRRRSPETGKAIRKVRGLDFSNRPWDNGWSPPVGPGRLAEQHPYHFINPNFRLANIAGDPGTLGWTAGQEPDHRQRVRLALAQPRRHAHHAHPRALREPARAAIRPPPSGGTSTPATWRPRPSSGGRIGPARR